MHFTTSLQIGFINFVRTSDFSVPRHSMPHLMRTNYRLPLKKCIFLKSLIKFKAFLEFLTPSQFKQENKDP